MTAPVPAPPGTTPFRPFRGRALASPVVMSLLAAVAVLTITAAADRWYVRLRTDTQHEQVAADARSAADAIHTLIVRRIGVLNGLAAFLRVNLDRPSLPTDFASFAEGLRQGTPGLRTVQYLRDGVIEQTWPLAGNESVVGYDVLRSPDSVVARDLRRAMTDSGVSLSGPLTLRQGGDGLIARLAVRDSSGRLLLIAAAVFDAGMVYAEARRATSVGMLEARLMAANDSTIWSNTDHAELDDPVRAPVVLPGVDWVLEAVPATGWAHDIATERRTLWAGGIALATLLAALAGVIEAWQATRLETRYFRDLRQAEDQFAEERTGLERRLMESHRLEAVGRLAGGVAHDFNNLITAIGGYAGLALADMPPDDPRRADLLEIQRASSRAAELTRQLLTFARRQVVLPRRVDLRSVVDNTAPMLRQLIGDSAGLVVQRHAEPVPVLVDPAQVEQALVNLVVNARDATPHGGMVTIATTMVDGRPMLSVQDDGCGIPADALPHIFEPFFTTKAPGQGTGLGLATVYGIVEQAGGRIDVDSAVGTGTRFRITFAPTDGAAPAELMAPTTRMSPGTEAIMVVDDEHQIRDICARVLGRLGYSVTTASDGREALAGLRDGPTPSLILTDLVMPGMGGLALHAQLEQEWPGVRTVLMSGYSADVAMVGTAGIPFLLKPFTATELAAIVRETLDAGRDG